MSESEEIISKLKELGQLLKFENTYLPKNHPLTQEIFEVDKLHQQGKFKERNLGVLKLLLLHKNLLNMKNIHLENFNYYIKKLHAINYDNYFGWRLEVNVASELIDKKTTYKVPDVSELQGYPDFDKVDDKNISIECTSIHFKKKPHYMRKLKEKIKEKSEKQYCMSNSALFIDITNLLYNAEKREKYFTRLDFQGTIQQISNHKNFGSILLFYYYYSDLKPTIKHVHLRYDHSKIDQMLLTFLNKYYASRPDNAEPDYVIPKNG